MIYEMICNETGERFITFTEVYQEPLNIKNRIRINKHRFSKSEKGENTYSFNLLENCFDEIGIVPFPLFTERKKFYLHNLLNINHYKASDDVELKPENEHVKKYFNLKKN